MSGAGVLIYYKKDGNVYLLTGKESKYLEDDNPGILNPEMQRFQGTKEDAKTYFSSIAKQLSEDLSTPHQRIIIKYDEPKLSEGTTDIYTVHMRIINNASHGIPKGGIEDGETTVETALREVREEVGMNLPSGGLTPVGRTRQRRRNEGYDIFENEIKSSTPERLERIIKTFKDVIKSREARHYGEMYDLKFRPLHEIHEILSEGKFNVPSHDAIMMKFPAGAPGNRGGSKRRKQSKINRKSKKSRKTLRKKKHYKIGSKSLFRVS